MQWLWTWGGVSFGYRDGDHLWTHDGRHVGRFDGDEVYGPDGRYLGEIRSKDRLITDLAKKLHRSSPFTRYARRAGYARYAPYVGYVMYAGYEEFPAPEELQASPMPLIFQSGSNTDTSRLRARLSISKTTILEAIAWDAFPLTRWR